MHRELFFPLGLCAQVFFRAALGYADPLSFSNEFPLNQVHLSARVEAPRMEKEKEISIEGKFLWTNSFVLEESYIIDAESRKFSLDINLPMGENTDLSLELPMIWRGGGVLDSVIKNWHEFFDLPEGKRESVPDDQYAVEGINENGERFSLSDQGSSLGNFVLRATHAVWRDDEQLLALRASASLPTSTKTFGHRGMDGELSLLYGWSIASWKLFSGAGMFFYYDDSIGGVEYEPLHPEGFVGAGYEFSRNFMLQTALYGGQQSAKDIPELPSYFLYLDVAAKVRLSSDLVFSLGLRENPAPHEGTADVTFLLSLSNY